MRVLIISMTCGEAHNSTAKALKTSLDAKGAVCEIVQLYGFDEDRVARKNKTYITVTKVIPKIYERIWFRTREKPIKSYIEGVIKDCKDYALKNITAFNPDAIVCTHCEAGAVVARLVENGEINKNIKTYSVVLDYCLSPYWENDAGLDFIVYPHENMLDEMLSKGFKNEQLLPHGIPVNEKFTKEYDKSKAREELGADKEMFTVALYSGGNCVSSAYAAVKKLLKCKADIQIIAVCGRNKKEFDKIETLKAKKGLTNILNFGFCDCLEKVYAAADVVITRGGMGVTEQINAQIPFVLREKLITCERLNAEFFEKFGLCIRIKKAGDISGIIDSLANDSNKLRDMREKAKCFCKPSATADFIEHILTAKK